MAARRTKRKPPTTSSEDLGGRIKSVIERGVSLLERRMETLGKGRQDASKAAAIAGIVRDAATMLGHVRRYDESMRVAAKQLSPALVIAYLRGLSAERRLGILGELGVDMDDDQEQGSVLS